jgi:hypothetical protein
VARGGGDRRESAARPTADNKSGKETSSLLRGDDL